MVDVSKVLPARLRSAIKSRLVRIETSRAYEIVIDPTYRPLAGKTAVVTGASGAIGRSIAIRLAADGAHVIGVARNSQKLDALVDEITALGGVASAESVDLANAHEVRLLASRLGRIDIVVNNAGGSSRGKNAYVWDQAAETVDEILNINLRAAILSTSAFGAAMVASDIGGRIINLGSAVAVGGLSKFSEYAAAKAGVVGFTRSAALEFGPHGITINCVSPGIILRDQVSSEAVARALSKAVLTRLGTPEDIAEMVSFLSGPRAGWITGQEFVIDGGRSLGLHGEL